MTEQLEKIALVRRIIEGKNITVEVDGGINEKTAELCVKSGADVLVVGNAFYKSDNPAEFVKKIKKQTV